MSLCTTKVTCTTIEQVESYIYRGRAIIQDGHLLPEVKRRIKLRWAAVGKVDNIMRSRNAGQKVKRKIFREYVLPVMTYGSETWVLKKATKELMSVVQRKMERIMVGISLRDQKCKTWIRQHTGTEDIVTTIRRNRYRWTGHVERFTDNRWIIKATEWSLKPWQRSRGRPETRWCDDLTHHLGST